MFLSYATVRSTFAGAKVRKNFDIHKKKNAKIFGQVKKKHEPQQEWLQLD
jgi:hypothetical protein